MSQNKMVSDATIEIDREHVKSVFKEYTDRYDVSDQKVRLKIEHTYRVAALCEEIARAEKMPKADIELAWLSGMLHDIGRFEQLKKYGTFIDSESVDHAQFGADILFGDKNKKCDEGMIREFIDDSTEDTLIENVIREHSVYRINEDLDERTKRICHVLRDADKIDILKVNTEFPLEEIYNTTTEKLRNAPVSKEVVDSFYEHKAVWRGLKKTIVDHVVGHCSLVFELVYAHSLAIMKEQGFIWKLLEFETNDEGTAKAFREMKKEMQDYLDSASEG